MQAFCHIRSTTNVGDLNCSPAPFFNFENPKLFNLGNLIKDENHIPPCDAVVFGGGAIEPFLRIDKIHTRVAARLRVAWGIGTSIHGKSSHGDLVRDLDLIGVREYGREGDGVEYVPCASCMSPLFDKHYDVRHDVVMFVNADERIKRPKIFGIPTLDNTASFEETIAWLGSGEVVVTNSFHGAYWASLLGRKVVCLAYSSKFFGFRYPPILMRDESEWRASLKMAASYDGEALEDARKQNLRFYEKFLELSKANNQN